MKPIDYGSKFNPHAFAAAQVTNISLNTPIPDQQKMAEVPQNVIGINDALERLAKSVAILEDRVRPVLRDFGPQDCAARAEAPACCTLGGTLQDFCSRIHGWASAIENITGRLEL